MERERARLTVLINPDHKVALLEEKAHTGRTIEDLIDEILSRWRATRGEKPRARTKPGPKAVAAN